LERRPRATNSWPHAARQLTAYKRPSEIVILELCHIVDGQDPEAPPERVGEQVAARNGNGSRHGRRSGLSSAAAIAKKFAIEGFTVSLGRPQRRPSLRRWLPTSRAPAAGVGAPLDARKEEDITAFLQERTGWRRSKSASSTSGANVNFPFTETTSASFRKVWEMACYSGFLPVAKRPS